MCELRCTAACVLFPEMCSAILTLSSPTCSLLENGSQASKLRLAYHRARNRLLCRDHLHTHPPAHDKGNISLLTDGLVKPVKRRTSLLTTRPRRYCCGATPNTKPPAAPPGVKLKPANGAEAPGASSAACSADDAPMPFPLAACGGRCCCCCTALPPPPPFQLKRPLPGCACGWPAACGSCSPPKLTELLPRHFSSNSCSRCWSPAWHRNRCLLVGRQFVDRSSINDITG